MALNCAPSTRGIQERVCPWSSVSRSAGGAGSAACARKLDPVLKTATMTTLHARTHRMRD